MNTQVPDEKDRDWELQLHTITSHYLSQKNPKKNQKKQKKKKKNQTPPPKKKNQYMLT